MAIYLIRHGETEGNAARVVQRPEMPLSERGRVQAGRLGERLAGAGIGRVLASDLVRARMTAEAIAEATGAALALEPLLQERNFGEARGVPYAELGIDLFAAEYAPPGGECWAVFHARVERAWQRVRAEAEATEGHLAVVTHGLVCLSLLARHLAVPEGLAPEPTGVRNASLTIVRAAPPFRVELLGCTAHLGDPGPAGTTATPV